MHRSVIRLRLSLIHIFFTTGRGTPTGNAIVPVLKVTANGHTYQWMEDNMDVDLSGIIKGTRCV